MSSKVTFPVTYEKVSCTWKIYVRKIIWQKEVTFKKKSLPHVKNAVLGLMCHKITFTSQENVFIGFK